MPSLFGAFFPPGWHHQGSEVHPVSSSDTRQSLQAKTRPMMTVLTRTCLPGSSCDQTYSSHHLQNKKPPPHTVPWSTGHGAEHTGLRLRAPVCLKTQSLWWICEHLGHTHPWASLSRRRERGAMAPTAPLPPTQEPPDPPTHPPSAQRARPSGGKNRVPLPPSGAGAPLAAWCFCTDAATAENRPSPCHLLWSLSIRPPSAAPCHARSSSILRPWSPHSRLPLGERHL